MSELATLLNYQSDVSNHYIDSSSSASVPGSPQMQLISAEVRSTDNGRVVLNGYDTYPVIQAASCLVLPEKGDVVSAIIKQQKIYIMAILIRAAPDTPLVLNSREMPLHFVTPSLQIHSAEKVEIHTENFSLIARTSLWLAHTLHQFAESLFVKVKQATKEVENTDTTQARHINIQADQSLMINSRLGSLNASAVLKIDGGQVHMG